MFIHDHYKKLAIEAIKKDLKNFNEDCLEEIAYNEKDFNNRIFIFSYVTPDNINAANEVFKSNLNDYMNIIADAIKK